jgi:hypothetical protein
MAFWAAAWRFLFNRERWDLRQSTTTRQLGFRGPVMQFVLAQNVEFGAVTGIGGTNGEGAKWDERVIDQATS